MKAYRQSLMEDLIAVELIDVPDGSIKLPDWTRSLRGRVIGVGEGRTLPQGVRTPMNCRVGDLVGFGPTAGMDSVYDGAPIRIMRDTDVDVMLESAE